MSFTDGSDQALALRPWLASCSKPWFSLVVAIDYVTLAFLRHQAVGRPQGYDVPLCLPGARRFIEGGTNVSANGRTLGHLLSKCENKNSMIALLKSKRGRIPPALPGLDVDAFWANCADLLWTLRPFSPAGQGRRSQGVRAEWFDTRMGLACSEPMMSGDPLPLWERSYTVTEQEACLLRSPGSLLSRAITPGAGTVLHLGPTIWLGSWCPHFANCDLNHDGSGAATLIEAAYRYARHEPGAHVVLFGTGNPAHVEPNVRAILQPPLPQAHRQQIEALFGALEGVGLDEVAPLRRA